MRCLLRNLFGEGRVENFIWLALILSTLATAAGFWVGIPCQKWAFGVGVGVALALLAVIGGCRCCLGFVSVMGVCWVLAAWTFPYGNVDYDVYHAPMQRLLISGWNPVFQSMMEDVSLLTADGCSVWRTLFFAHGCELVCAVVAKGTGLFLADSFLSYFSAYALLVSAYRFAAGEWQGGTFARVLFALVVAFPFAFFVTFMGMIDYALYATLALALLSICNYERGKRMDDLFAAFVGLSFAAIIKANGVYLSAIGFVYLFVRYFRFASVRTGVLLSFLFVCVVSATPYLSAWVQYGSPFYPMHTFDPDIKVFDVNDDFSANADGLAMGYFARIVYAWFSTKLAILGSAWWTGRSNFAPQFYVPGGVAGMKILFKIMMWSAVAALICAKKNRISVLCLVVFLLANLAPLRYIGYGRYFAIIWLIPPLAAYNLMHAPIDRLRPLMPPIRICVYVVFSILAVSIFAKATGHFIRLAALEGMRQKELVKAVGQGYRIEPKDERRRFIVQERLRNVAGFVYEMNNNAENSAFSDKFLMPGASHDVEKQLEDEFPVCNTLKDYQKFQWRKAFSNWPKPLWERRIEE